MFLPQPFIFGHPGLLYGGMEWSELGRNLRQIWQDKPGVILLLVVGFAGFLYLVVDTWRHKRRRRPPR
jgi:hypothetical protein